MQRISGVYFLDATHWRGVVMNVCDWVCVCVNSCNGHTVHLWFDTHMHQCFRLSLNSVFLIYLQLYIYVYLYNWMTFVFLFFFIEMCPINWHRDNMSLTVPELKINNNKLMQQFPWWPRHCRVGRKTSFNLALSIFLEKGFSSIICQLSSAGEQNYMFWTQCFFLRNQRAMSNIS